jgi:peptide/nickel transport system ATP-binding protein
LIPLVKLQGVSHFFGPVQALDNIDLVVLEAESWGVAGPSGSGKSTLGRILTLHQKPSTGSIELLGFPVGNFNSKGLRQQKRRLQLVFQDPADTFDHQWETWEIIAEADAIAGQDRAYQMRRAIQLLEKVQLPRECITRSALELSGGERRRVAIARALAADPHLLVLDESFSGLDGCVQAELSTLLEELQRETRLSIIHISHDLRLLRRVSRNLLVFERGRVVETGPTASVLADPKSEMTRKLLRSSGWSPR